MPTLRFGKVWQVIRHFGVLFIAKTVISIFVTTQILLPHIFPHMVTGQKMVEDTKKSSSKMYYFLGC